MRRACGELVIALLSMAESPDRIARAEAFKSGLWLSTPPEASSLPQHLVPSASPNRNQRCLGTFDRNSESEKSEVGTTGRPLISVPVRDSGSGKGYEYPAIPTGERPVL